MPRRGAANKNVSTSTYRGGPPYSLHTNSSTLVQHQASAARRNRTCKRQKTKAPSVHNPLTSTPHTSHISSMPYARLTHASCHPDRSTSSICIRTIDNRRGGLGGTKVHAPSMGGRRRSRRNCLARATRTQAECNRVLFPTQAISILVARSTPEPSLMRETSLWRQPGPQVRGHSTRLPPLPNGTSRG